METKQTVTEWANDHLGLTLAITKRLHEEQTPFQHIEIVETEQYGRLLILDGVFQTSVKDEWTYHEMIAHVPLMMHPHPERVLIIGGGDGGVAREVCRLRNISRRSPKSSWIRRRSFMSMWEMASLLRPR